MRDSRGIPLAYIECAGARVPWDWTPEQLRDALGVRKIRFANEDEVMTVFGNAIRERQALKAEIEQLRAEKAKLKELGRR